MEVVTQLIASVGFPIVACIIMYKHQAEMEQRIDARDKEHREELAKFVEVINNNTLAITELKNQIERGVE